MERLTDEVQIGPFAALKDKAEAVPGAFGTYDCFYAHEVAVTRLKQYEDTGLTPEEIMALIPPPNVPLTLEELLGMDGEPVWVVNVSSINHFKGHWDICEWENGEVVTFPYCMEEPDLDLLGVNWFAYRRKPEEGKP